MENLWLEALKGSMLYLSMFQPKCPHLSLIANTAIKDY